MDEQISMLSVGELDIISDISSTSDKFKALIMEKLGAGLFITEDYSRPGYGFLRFHCDFGPTMFTGVRRALVHIIDIENFSREYNHGMGNALYGPYSTDFSMWQASEASIDLNYYEYSVEIAEKLLEEEGWIYDSKGGDYTKGMSGADSVRYKKLSADEATEVNQNYASINNTDGITYKTVKIDGEYYMPLVINWYAATESDVYPILAEIFSPSGVLSELGMAVHIEEGNFSEATLLVNRSTSDTPVYGMFNMAMEYIDARFDYAWNWTVNEDYFNLYSINYLVDEYDIAFPYYGANGHKSMTYDEAYKASGGKLGLDYISMAMIYDSKNEEEYNTWWRAYIERWNALVPDAPLYCDMYYDVYNSCIINYDRGSFVSRAMAILYASVNLDF